MTDDERRKFVAQLDDADRWVGDYLTYSGLISAEVGTAYTLRGHIATCRLYAADKRATAVECDRHQAKVRRGCMTLHPGWLKSGP